MIIDHDDMVAAGMVKEASDFLPDNTDVQYALYLNTPSGFVGKFRVSSPQDIMNSVSAINKNASLPDYIKNPAMHFIQKAATDNNVITGWGELKDGIYSRYIDYKEPVEETKPLYVMKIAGQRDVQIFDSRDYQVAVDMFKTSPRAYSGREKIAVAADLLKTAIMLKVACDPYVHSYAYANYSKQAPAHLGARIKMAPDDETREQYGFLKNAMAKLGDTLPPDVFITAIEGIDKAAGINRDPVEFFD